MKVRQLQYLCEIAKHHCNISAAAKALHTSQPGVSKQIQLLESELGGRLFLRAANRLAGLTPMGERVLESAHRVMNELSFIAAVSQDDEKSSSGVLTVAATHTQAKHFLPAIIKRFTQRHSRVHVTIRHETPAKIIDLLRNGEAHLAVTTNAPRAVKDLIVLPSHRFERVIVVPGEHPLLRERRITLKMLTKFPLVMYDMGFTGRDEVLKCFERAKLHPAVALRAGDADVIKSCVEHGLGIAVLLSVVCDPERDRMLRVIPADHLFPAANVSVVVHRQHYLRSYEYDFIEMLASRWHRSDVERMVKRRCANRELRFEPVDKSIDRARRARTVSLGG